MPGNFVICVHLGPFEDLGVIVPFGCYHFQRGTLASSCSLRVFAYLVGAGVRGVGCPFWFQQLGTVFVTPGRVLQRGVFVGLRGNLCPWSVEVHQVFTVVFRGGLSGSL